MVLVSILLALHPVFGLQSCGHKPFLVLLRRWLTSGVDFLCRGWADGKGYVSYKDIKRVVADLKKIYGAVTLEEAEKNLQAFAETWRKQYPSCVKSW